MPGCLTAGLLACPPTRPTQTFNELSARESIDPGDLLPLQTQLEELESALMDLEMYEVSLLHTRWGDKALFDSRGIFRRGGDHWRL